MINYFQYLNSTERDLLEVVKTGAVDRATMIADGCTNYWSFLNSGCHVNREERHFNLALLIDVLFGLGRFTKIAHLIFNIYYCIFSLHDINK